MLVALGLPATARPLPPSLNSQVYIVYNPKVVSTDIAAAFPALLALPSNIERMREWVR